MWRAALRALAAVLLLLIGCSPSPGEADSGEDCYVVSVALDPTEARGTSDWVSLADGTAGTGGYTTKDQYIVPVRDLYAHHLFVDVDVAPGTGAGWEINLINETPPTLTCRILDTATTCSSLEIQPYGINLVAGRSLAPQINSTPSGYAGTPAAAAEMRITFCTTRNR